MSQQSYANRFGWTNATDFPITLATAFQTTITSSSWCRFVSRIDTSKSGISSLKYSSYLCGTGSDWPGGLALDSQSNVYVSSEVWSQDFPTTLGPSNTRSPHASMMALSKVNTNFS